MIEISDEGSVTAIYSFPRRVPVFDVGCCFKELEARRRAVRVKARFFAVADGSEAVGSRESKTPRVLVFDRADDGHSFR